MHLNLYPRCCRLVSRELSKIWPSKNNRHKWIPLWKLWKWIKGTLWQEIAPIYVRCHTAKSTIPMPCLNFLKIFLTHLRLFLKTNLEAKMKKNDKYVLWGNWRWMEKALLGIFFYLKTLILLFFFFFFKLSNLQNPRDSIFLLYWSVILVKTLSFFQRSDSKICTHNHTISCKSFIDVKC